MAYQSFNNLEVWETSLELSVHIYDILRDCRDYGFRDQICRAAVSVPSNIAEGMERDSVRETVHFLHIAKGSCAEMRTQLIIAGRVGYIEQPMVEEMLITAERVSRMLHGLIKSLNSQGSISKPKT
jgi:four helix bundle protein